MSAELRHYYRLFGLNVASEIEFPELPAHRKASFADAEICLGKLGDDLPAGPTPALIEGGSAFSIPHVARYAVLNAQRIVVDPVDGAESRNVRLYLLGSAMGLLLHQKGLLPLHANAVEMDGRAFAFMGPSGSGKSTLAAWFHDQGHRVIADDVCAVRFDAGLGPLVSSGLPRLRLWRSALEATGRGALEYQRSYAGDDDWDKFDVPLVHGEPTDDAVSLTAAYLLTSGDSFSVERLGGIEAAEAVFANTYRGQYLDGAEQVRIHWQSCLKLISAIPIFRLSRKWGFELMDRDFRSIVEHCRSQLPHRTERPDDG